MVSARHRGHARPLSPRRSKKRSRSSTSTSPATCWNGMPGCRAGGTSTSASTRTEHYGYMKKVLQALTFLRGPRTVGAEVAAALRATRPADGDVPRRHRGLHPPRSRRGDPVRDHDDGLLRPAAPRSIEPQWLLDYWADRVERLLRGCVRDRDLVPAERSVDIAFHHLNGHECRPARRPLRTRGVELTAKVRRAFQGYLDGNPRGKHGSVRYELQRHFGVSPDELRSQFAFYFERFDVREGSMST